MEYQEKCKLLLSVLRHQHKLTCMFVVICKLVGWIIYCNWYGFDSYLPSTEWVTVPLPSYRTSPDPPCRLIEVIGSCSEPSSVWCSVVCFFLDLGLLAADLLGESACQAPFTFFQSDPPIIPSSYISWGRGRLRALISKTFFFFAMCKHLKYTTEIWQIELHRGHKTTEFFCTVL